LTFEQYRIWTIVNAQEANIRLRNQDQKLNGSKKGKGKGTVSHL